MLINNNYFPLGYAYNSYVKFDDFIKLKKEEKDIVLSKAYVLEKESKIPNNYNNINQFKITEIKQIKQSNLFNNLKEKRKIKKAELEKKKAEKRLWLKKEEIALSILDQFITSYVFNRSGLLSKGYILKEIMEVK